jgi:hypothetical protein
MTNTMTNTTARVLRNLKIKEISGVDSGAGRGVKIMMIKRARDPARELMEATMQNAALKRGVYAAWNQHADDLAKRLGSRSKALDHMSGEAPEAWAQMKSLSAADVLKATDEGRRVISETRNRMHSGVEGDGMHQHETTAVDEADADDDARYASASKSLQSFSRHVAAFQRQGMSASDAHTHAIRLHSDLWQKAKAARASEMAATPLVP